MGLYLFDDRTADGWFPFALSRPLGELRFGALLQRERLERWAGARAAGHLTRGWLGDFTEPGAPPAVSPADVPPDRDRLLVCSRLVPDPGTRFEPPDGPAVLLAGEAPAGCFLPAGEGLPGPGWLEEPDGLDGAGAHEVDGRLVEETPELVRDGPAQIGRDVRAHAPEGARVAAGDLPAGVWREGAGEVYLEEDVRLEPGVLLDAREGPIWLSRGVIVRSGSRLSGPLFAGPDTRVLGGSLEATAAGPACRIRGEVAEATLLGHVNKAHLGFLGHAVLGRWVNLGAATTNSDLKNNYGPVRMGGPDGPVETGLVKFGCLLGDHVKTAIGTLLGTGAVVGAGSNLFGDPRPPRYVPPFTWGLGESRAVHRERAFLETAETVMGRRDVPFTDGTARWLAAVWERAAEDAA